jgi:hypothetical protein
MEPHSGTDGGGPAEPIDSEGTVVSGKRLTDDSDS